MKNLNKPIMAALVGVSIVALAGCSQQARRSIGLERTPPDEFLVDRQLPLLIPPDFGLRPPVPVGEGKRGIDPLAQGQAIVAGNIAAGQSTSAKSDASAPRSPSDLALLKLAGVGTVNDSIRRELDRDLRQRQSEPPSMVKKLLSQ